MQQSDSLLPCISIGPVCADDYDFVFQDAVKFAHTHGLTIISQDIFTSADSDTISRLRNSGNNNEITWPIMCMQETSSNSQDLSIQFYATSCKNPTPIIISDCLIGYSFEDDYARYCVLRNVGASDARGSRIDQATQTWDVLEEGLNTADMRLNDLVRTWFFVDNILDWYGDFNHIRNNRFLERGMFDGVVPASTGIGIGNADGLALVAGAYAVRPKDDSVAVRSIPSPLQCPALEYGSSFSRAVEIGSPAGRLLMVSGTASIKPCGATDYVGDINGQISLTMDVVGAILNSRSMDWSSVTRATAYFKHFSDMPRFTEYLQSANIAGLPLACTTADICRDDLLFEIELDAYSRDTSPG